jgi:hypothetical protein
MTARKKRPRDFAQRAKMIVDIATGEIEDREPTPEEQAKYQPPLALVGAVDSRAEKRAPRR